MNSRSLIESRLSANSIVSRLLEQREYGFLYFPICAWELESGYFNNLVWSIRDLYRDDPSGFSLENGSGIVSDPYIPLLYGLQSTRVEDSEVEAFFSTLTQFTVVTTGTILEENGKFNTLKLIVKSDYLENQNAILRKNFSHIIKYSGYSPNIEIAYFKPKNGQNFVVTMMNEKDYGQIRVRSACYMKPGGEVLVYQLDDISQAAPWF